MVADKNRMEEYIERVENHYKFVKEHKAALLELYEGIRLADEKLQGSILSALASGTKYHARFYSVGRK